MISAAESAAILAEVQRREQDEAAARLKTSLHLWRQRKPVPGYVEIVTISADDDADGMKFADQLGQIVLQPRECKILVPS